MNVTRWYWAAFIATALFLSGFGWKLMEGIQGVGVSHRPFQETDFAVMVSFITLLSIILHRILGMKALPIFVLMGGFYLILVVPYFALVDESSHFAYIHHISTQFSIPTVQEPTQPLVLALGEHAYPSPPKRVASQMGLGGCIYEAMHPPLYYLIMSAMDILVPIHPVAKIYLLRFCGLLAFLGVVRMLLKIHSFTQDSSIGAHPILLYAVLGLYTLTPGILLRMCTISNFHLSLVLCVLFYLWIYKAISSETDLSRNWIVGLGLITGAAIATQFFNLTLIGVGTFFLLVKKRVKSLPLFWLLSISPITPWLIFNYHHYGHLTGWRLIYDRMVAIVNPEHIPYTFSTVVGQIPFRFFYLFWNAEESRQNWFCTQEASVFLSLLLIGAVTTSLVRRLWNRSLRDPCSLVEWISILGILLNFLLQFQISLQESVPAVLGRFMYPSLAPLILLTYRLLVRLPQRAQIATSWILVFTTSMLWSNLWIQGVLFQLQRAGR